MILPGALVGNGAVQFFRIRIPDFIDIEADASYISYAAAPFKNFHYLLNNSLGSSRPPEDRDTPNGRWMGFCNYLIKLGSVQNVTTV